MSIEEYRNSRNNNKKSIKNKFISFLNRVLITLIILFTGLILTNKNASMKELINKIVYNDSLHFSKVQDIYNKYFGKYVGIENNNKEQMVFDEKLAFNKSSKYKDGVMLETSNNYMIPSINSGVVIFMGEKEGYGNTIIVEQIDGINVWYSNINPKDIKMYDYIEKGTFIGEVKDTKLYLLFEKDGKFLDYKKYI